jgi:hypothetical protein
MLDTLRPGKRTGAMKIQGVSNLRSNAVKRGERSKQSSGSAFASALEPEPAGSAGVAAAGQVGALGALLTAQEVDDPTERNRRAARHGNGILDQLDELRFEILSGNVSKARLERLSALLAAGREVAEDPRLAEAIAEIELRAAVELAKLER